MGDMASIIEKIVSDDAIKGVVLTSGKDAPSQAARTSR